MNVSGQKRRYFFILLLSMLITGIAFWQLSTWNLIPKRTYRAEDFGIPVLQSTHDADEDGIDDYMDICTGARAYVQTKPKYKSEYYADGYPPEGIGVCTDVVWYAFANAGYSLKTLVDADIAAHPDAYPEITKADPNIDFRRVRNLKIFFERNAEILTTDAKEIAQFQPGDIIVYENHIAIVSDLRNRSGQPYIIHHGGQPVREEDALCRKTIIGHYRWTP